jgi:hypothetical protein
LALLQLPIHDEATRREGATGVEHIPALFSYYPAQRHSLSHHDGSLLKRKVGDDEQLFYLEFQRKSPVWRKPQLSEYWGSRQYSPRGESLSCTSVYLRPALISTLFGSS